MFYWLKRFKKPNEQKNNELLELYNSLTEENKALVDKKANGIITACLCLYSIMFFLFAGLYIFLTIMKVDAVFGLFVILMSLLPVYCVWSASTWKKAEPHNKLQLVYTLAVMLLNKQ